MTVKQERQHCLDTAPEALAEWVRFYDGLITLADLINNLTIIYFKHLPRA